jgi:very-short-patch-repair endonuclease
MVSLDTYRPFTRAAAVAAGITDATLRGPQYRRLFHKVHINAGVVLTPLVYAEAALLLHPAGAFVSYHTAADVYRLPVPDDPDVHVSVFTKSDRRRRAGIRNHLARADAAVTTKLGLRVSTPTQLFLELASCLHLVDLVVLGDAMVKRGLVTEDGLRKACAGSTLTGAKAAERAASYVRPGVDSPMESRLRMLIVLSGLPEPRVNLIIRRRDGSVMLRFDLCYPEWKIVVEYDGGQHRSDEDQWERDIERRDWFDDTGWKQVRIVSRGIYRRPHETVERVRKALADRGCTTLPRRLTDDWRPYFPVRAA